MKRVLMGVITGVLVIAILMAAGFGLGWFGVEAERTIIQNSRQYIITQQRHLVGLAQDCAELESKIAETDDDTLVATYERQQDAIDRQMEAVIVTLDPSDVPPGTGECR
jgi:hypothetical protein